MTKCKPISANDTALLNGKEADEQIELIRWWDHNICINNEKYWTNQLFAIPNGGTRNVVEAVRLKKQGVRKGVSDLMLAVPSGKYHGLFIEMKRASGGKASTEQIDFIKYVRKLGYAAYITHGSQQAKYLITNYLQYPDSLWDYDPLEYDKQFYDMARKSDFLY